MMRMMKKKKLKNRIVLTLTLVLLAALFAALLASCGGDPENTPSKTPTTAQTQSDPSSDVPKTNSSEDGDKIFEIEAPEGVTVNVRDEIIDIEVPGSLTVFELGRYVRTRSDISWKVSKDETMNTFIEDKRLTLETGESLFYVSCTAENPSRTWNYTLIIHRDGVYTVSFEGIDEKQNVGKGGFASEPAGIPTKEGYQFKKWDYDFAEPIFSDLTITAVWEANKYRITYDPALGSVGRQTAEASYGEEVVLETPTRDGYNFVGWFYGDTAVKSGVWTFTEDVTLVAKWVNKPFTVTLDPNGGEIDGPTEIQVEYGSEFTLPLPARTGYSFGGWFDGNRLVENGIFEYWEDLTLTAHWNQRSATITFVENGGQKGTHTEVVPFDGTLPLPVREGFTFGGWFSDEQLGTAVDAVPEVTEAIRLYAWWTEEGKPSEFIYELSGTKYKVTERIDRMSTLLVPKYIGGLEAVDAVEKPNPNAGIVIREKTIRIRIGRTTDIQAVFTPVYASDDTTLVYESSNPAIASVDENGAVTGIASGMGICSITVKNPASNISEVCFVEVLSGEKNPDASLTVENKIIYLPIGGREQIRTVYFPEYEDDAMQLVYTVSDETIVSVDGNGVLTGLAVGSCTVYVRSAEGVFSEECSVSVADRSAPITFIENGGSRGVHAELVAFDGELPVPERAGFTFGGWFSDEELTAAAITVPQTVAPVRLYAWWTEEGKPSEFVYELVGSEYKITARVDRTSTSLIPAYIGGLKTIDAVERPNPNAGITFPDETIDVNIDRFASIGAIFTPVYSDDDATLVYKSSNAAVATVDANGTVKGVGAGICAVTVTNPASGMTANCFVTVSSEEKNPNALLRFESASLRMAAGDSTLLRVIYIPEYAADDRHLLYTVSDESVASVDENGRLTALAAGNCEVTVMDAYKTFSDVCYVIVSPADQPNPDAGVVIEKDTLTVKIDRSVAINAVFTPVYPNDDKTLKYESSNPAVASVDASGVVRGLSSGSSTITVSNPASGLKATCFVAVLSDAKNPNASITLDSERIQLTVGETAKLNAVYIPEYSDDNRQLLYAVMNEAVASVDGSGVLTAKALGETVVVVRNAEGTYSDTCVVAVVNQKENENPGIKLSATVLNVNTGWKKTVTAVYTPRYVGGDTALVWESGNPAVASVENGVITAVGAGNCKITVRDKANEFSASVTVNVRQAGVFIESADTHLYTGETGRISAYVLPDKEDGSTEVVYSTADSNVATTVGGVIYAHGKGKTQIFAKSADGKFSASVELTVDNQKPEFAVHGKDYVDVTSSGNEWTLTVKEDRSYISLKELVETREGYSWILSRNVEMTEEIITKTVSLPESGSVTVYAFCRSSDGSYEELFILHIVKDLSA